MDNLTKEQRHKSMTHIRYKDTKIEVILRKALWAEGIRYRKNYTALAGKPDIVITKYRIAIFCDSSFWHGRNFEEKKKPATNAEYWDKKIRRNMERDDEVTKQLRFEGWTVIRFWDYEITKHLDDCVKTVKEAIQETILSFDENMMYDNNEN